MFRYDGRLAAYGKTIIKGQVNDAGEVYGNGSYLGLELRLGWLGSQGLGSTQFQTVIPPSLMANGAARKWNNCSEILPVPESVLRDLDAYATAAPLAPPAPIPEAKPKGRPRPRRSDGPTPLDRARAYLAKVEPAISGQRGHNQTFKAACKVGPGFDLPRDQALALLREWNAGNVPPWSEKELLHKVDDAYRKPERGGLLKADRPTVRNGHAPKNGVAHGPIPAAIFANYRQGDDGGKVPLRVQEMADALAASVGGWPKRVGDELFWEDEAHQPVYLDSSTRLFAWIDRRAQVAWAKGERFIPQDRFYEHLRMNSERYDAIEVLPHWPRLPHVYYMHRRLPPATKHLDRLLNLFNPDTPEDHELIRAMILTMLWGGAAGRRPAFLVTGSDDDPEQGRGLGKSTLVDVLADELVGGSIDVSPTDAIADVKTRLLSEGARQMRIARLDNVKTLKFSWADLEGLITAPEISGRQLYKGEGRRPNTLIWCITLNGASLSKDMAQRVIPIKLRRPKFQPTWEHDVRAFARERRWDILADVEATLTTEPGPLVPATRWAAWEREVLSKVGRAEECQALVMTRQGTVDDDNAERDVVADQFRGELRRCGYDPETACVFIRNPIVAAWVSRATRTHYATNAASAYLKSRGISELQRATKNSGTDRGWVWRGARAVEGAASGWLQDPEDDEAEWMKDPEADVAEPTTTPAAPRGTHKPRRDYQQTAFR